MPDEKSPKVGGGLVGAGGGTGFVGILNMIPEHYHWLRDSLVYFAPLVTVGFGFIWIMVKASASRKIVEWQLKSAIAKTTVIRDRVMADPQSTREEKKNAKDAVTNLTKLEMEVLHEGVTSIRAKLKNLNGDD